MTHTADGNSPAQGVLECSNDILDIPSSLTTCVRPVQICDIDNNDGD